MLKSIVATSSAAAAVAGLTLLAPAQAFASEKAFLVAQCGTAFTDDVHFELHAIVEGKKLVSLRASE